MEVLVFSKVFEVGVSSGILQQLLRRCYNQWLSIVSPHLSPQQMEEVRRCRRVNHLHVHKLGLLAHVVELVT